MPTESVSGLSHSYKHYEMSVRKRSLFWWRTSPTRSTSTYSRLRHAGVNHPLYVPGERILGDDREGTVDGVHPTDVGFMRIAGTISVVVEALL